MDNYKQEIELYFELKGTPESSRESYTRRIYAFINFNKGRHNCMEDITVASHFDLDQNPLAVKINWIEKTLLANRPAGFYSC